MVRCSALCKITKSILQELSYNPSMTKRITHSFDCYLFLVQAGVYPKALHMVELDMLLKRRFVNLEPLSFPFTLSLELENHQLHHYAWNNTLVTSKCWLEHAIKSIWVGLIMMRSINIPINIIEFGCVLVWRLRRETQ